jgi:hypothetical protein
MHRTNSQNPIDYNHPPMAVEEPGRVAESAAPHPSARLALWILVALAVLTP